MVVSSLVETYVRKLLMGFIRFGSELKYRKIGFNLIFSDIDVT